MPRGPRAGVRVEEDGGVLRVTIARPAVGNALGPDDLRTLLDAADRAANSDTVRVVVLRGEGKHFCNGVDLRQSNAPGPKPRAGHLARRVTTGPHRLVSVLSRLPVPVVVGVHGTASGLGLSLALLGDYVVAAENASFWAPFVHRGFSPDSGTTFLLPRLVGPARAREMLLLGRRIDAPTALSWGMVNEVVPDEELDEALGRVTAEFASAATVAVGLAKGLVARNADGGLDQALANEAAAVETAVRSDDFKAAIAAFLRGGTTEFTGR